MTRGSVHLFGFFEGESTRRARQVSNVSAIDISQTCHRSKNKPPVLALDNILYIGRLCPGLKHPCATPLHSVAVIGCHHTALPACGLDSGQRFSVIHRLHGLDSAIDNVSMRRLDHQVINQPARHRQPNDYLGISEWRRLED